MGRKLFRVPLDFAWPLKMIWKGYVCPYASQKCEACRGGGYNPATEELAVTFFSRWEDDLTQDEVDALVAGGRLAELHSTWTPGKGRVPMDPPPVITAAQVNALAKRSPMLHDSINQHLLVRTRATRLGVFGYCQICEGEGRVWQSRRIKRLAAAWKSRNPPRGPGFQLWETTSEGSPVSPVFPTLDALCTWCEGNATTFGNEKTSAAEWKRMLAGDIVHHTTTLPNGDQAIFI